MLIVPERDISMLMTPEAAFDAVEKVFAAMSAGKAYNFLSSARRSAMKMRFTGSRVVLIALV